MKANHHALRKLFAGITEQTFLGQLGIGDPGLIDYLSELLARFSHMDSIYRLRSVQGKKLEEVFDMVVSAEGMPEEGRTRREMHRHIGDFTLFWTGVYPEILERFRSVMSKDHFVDYCAQGKRSYYIASTFDGAPFEEEAPVLRRLSEEFEVCAYGLSQVRQEWEKIDPGTSGPLLAE